MTDTNGQETDTVGNRSPLRRWGDLRARVLTAAIIMLVTGVCIYVGSFLWLGFVLLGGILLIREWDRLVRHRPSTQYYVWLIFGLIYIGLCVFFLVYMRERPKGMSTLYSIIIGVIATDTGAYFLGRFVGGKKIAPAISPSKTWAGLIGGAFFCSFSFIILFSWVHVYSDFVGTLSWLGNLNVFLLNLWAIVTGALLAVVAQCGDFFESWMKRRANVKDSGTIFPGHGGVFDRVDGLLAVTLVAGATELITSSIG